jgi:hypothetical protein
MLFRPCDQSTLVLSIYNREIVLIKKSNYMLQLKYSSLIGRHGHGDNAVFNQNHE